MPRAPRSIKQGVQLVEVELEDAKPARRQGELLAHESEAGWLSWITMWCARRASRPRAAPLLRGARGLT